MVTYYTVCSPLLPIQSIPYMPHTALNSFRPPLCPTRLVQSQKLRLAVWTEMDKYQVHTMTSNLPFVCHVK